ncbi:MAG: hypothetical protein EXS46_00255 [Candidatus Taylorbacteria bacterium]|nr:hypothetical protein [Candidatus Taylorbacteria bacterium]
MKMWKIVLYHLAIFALGIVCIGAYFTHKISALPPGNLLEGIALLPVAVVFMGIFGFLCLFSLIIFSGVSFLKGKVKQHTKVFRR